MHSQTVGFLADMLLTRAVDRLKLPKETLELAEGLVRAKDNTDENLTLAQLARSIHHLGLPMKWQGCFDPDTTPLKKEGQSRPYGAYAFACQMAQVEVDVLTGEVEIIRMVAAHDVGRAVSPANLVGQICGGVAMGMGYALLEEFEPGKTEPLKDYHLVTALEDRIADLSSMRHQTAAWTKRRNASQNKIDWRFTNKDARIKLKRLYPKLYL